MRSCAGKCISRHKTACASSCGLDALIAWHMGVMSRLNATPKPPTSAPQINRRVARLFARWGGEIYSAPPGLLGFPWGKRSRVGSGDANLPFLRKGIYSPHTTDECPRGAVIHPPNPVESCVVPEWPVERCQRCENKTCRHVSPPLKSASRGDYRERGSLPANNSISDGKNYCYSASDAKKL